MSCQIYELVQNSKNLVHRWNLATLWAWFFLPWPAGTWGWSRPRSSSRAPEGWTAASRCRKSISASESRRSAKRSRDAKIGLKWGHFFTDLRRQIGHLSWNLQLLSINSAFLLLKSVSKVLGQPSQSQQRPHLPQDFWDRLYILGVKISH